MLGKLFDRLFKRQQLIMEKKEADKKYEKYKSLDPFPDIKPALLNSADIENYVEATGMIEPFDNKKLKSASYEARIGGVCKYWDENGNEQEITIDKPHKTFTLKPNSIAFIEVEPKFRLPDYIALRFNLKITHVYRGLLLGTGPLIDPGYEGKIYIPLHNLTSNSYTFEYGEGLIWIEFTKISELDRWKGKESDGVEKIGVYVPFREDKKNQTLDYFLNKANKGPIRSSIPKAVGEAAESARQAEKSAKTLSNIGYIAGIGVLISITILVSGLIYNSWVLQRNYLNEMSELKMQISKQQDSFKKTEKDLISANMQINELKTKIDAISKNKKESKELKTRTDSVSEDKKASKE